MLPDLLYMLDYNNGNECFVELQVRDELEHLLDDNEDMAHLYLTRKQTQT